MAITKIWNIAKSKDGNLSNSLHRSLLYIVKPVKTDGGVLVGGVNVMPDAELAYEQMCETKQTFGKELGRQGYHVVLSCPVGEGDPQTMYQLTQEFIEEYLGNRYEALFAVHVDKGHLHSHIVFNSVSMIDGYKYQYTKGDWKKIIQPITNHLCEKYGWSVIPPEYVKDSERMSRGEYEYQKSLKEVMLADVEYCMSNAENMDEFIWNLKELGYEVKKGKHLAIKAGGMKKFRRLDTLDERFSVGQIEETLAAIQGKDTTVKLITNYDYKSFKHWTSEYQRSFYVKIVRLRQMEVYRFQSKAARRYHDLKRMNELQEQYLYLVNHKIESADEMLEHHAQIEEKIADISAEQKMIYAENRKLGRYSEDEAETMRQDNKERLEALKNRKKELNHELKLADSIITESLYQSYFRLEFEPETNKDKVTDPLHPAIPESPWEKERKDAEYKKRLDELLAKLHADEEARKEKERKELVAEQERKRKLEADKRRMEAEKEQKTRKLLAYSRWQLDANDKFYEAVGFPSSDEYAGEYLIWMSEQMKIKQEQKPLEYFEGMLPSYDEYVREKYPESIELGYELSKQESKPTTLQQNDGMDNIANDEVNKVQNPASDNLTEVPAELQAEPQATPQLPDSFSAFKSLPVSTQSQLLCTELCDTMQVFEQLQQYAKDTGYYGSFDEIYEMASAISEENSRSYEDRKAQMIADELIRAGTTAQNFYQIKTESLAEAFLAVGDIGLSLIPLIINVEQKIGVTPDYEKNLALVNAMQTDVKNYGERNHHGKGHHNRQICDWGA